MVPRAARVPVMAAAMAALVVPALSLSASGCSTLGRRSALDTDAARRASYIIDEQRGREDTLVILALSGGGSRAAYFSAAAMLRLETVFGDEINLLKEVDVLSSVSGGSLAAAYYAVSQDADGAVGIEMPSAPAQPLPPERLTYDAQQRRLTAKGRLSADDLSLLLAAFPGEEGRIQKLNELSARNAGAARIWKPSQVLPKMSHNYLLQWFAHWLLPHNIVRYLFTPYSRTDIMAQIFADEMYDRPISGWDLTFADLNPERPYLILNATDATARPSGGTFSIFTFTTDDFHAKLGEPLGPYPVGDGVMASAAFPAVFNYANLPKRTPHGKRWVHLFDGGNRDNLGLASADTVMSLNWDKFRKIVVLLVDSFTEPSGVPETTRDARWPWGYVIDTNFLQTFDALLAANRENMLAWFENRYVVEADDAKVSFCHLKFADVPDATLRRKLNAIPTSFTIADDDTGYLDEAAKILIDADNACLRRVKDLLLTPR